MKRTPPRPWRVLDRRTLLAHPWLSIHEDRVALPNGSEISQFHVLEVPSWTGTLCLTRDDEVVLVRQYRHGIAEETLELPAGMLEAGETPLEGAQRELREETGYVAERWESIATFACDPSRQTVRAHFFFALGAVSTDERSLDESEDIEIVRVPRGELGALLESGQIEHGIHVGAILLAARRGLVAL